MLTPRATDVSSETQKSQGWQPERHPDLDLTNYGLADIRVKQKRQSSESQEAHQHKKTPAKHLDLTDPYGDSTRKAGKQEWTVAIDLTATKGSEKHPVGAPDQLEKLEQLREESKGKPVTIIAQLVAENPMYSEKTRGSQPRELLERYKIHDGQITRLPTQDSHGFAKDTASLLHLAATQAPSRKIGLIVQSDGGGVKGLKGDEGKASLPQFSEAVKAGLKGSGHDKLDVLDFDCCLMGQNGVLGKVESLTDSLVASSETESANTKGLDGQNLGAAMHDLLENPSMDGNQLGEKIVADANEGENGHQKAPDGSGTISGTNTLSHYGMTKYNQFDTAFNDFGKQLAAADKDQHNRQVIEELIKQTRRYGKEADPDEVHLEEARDLKSFAEKIERAANDGQLNDPHGVLGKATRNLLEAQKQLVESYHGDTHGGYDKLGGLSAFLPSADSLKVDEQAEKSTMLHLISQLANSRNFKPSGQSYYKKCFEQFETVMEKHLPPQSRGELKGLKDAIDSLDPKADYKSFRAGMEHIQRIAEGLTHVNDQLAMKLVSGIKAQDKRALQEQVNPRDSGWDQFLDSLGA